MPTEAKVHAVEEFSQVLEGAKSVILTDFTGLDVAAVSKLRRQCREAGVEYHVVKNTLARRALARVGMQGLEPLLAGPNAWAIHPTDQIVAAKLLSEFAKANQNLKIRGGYVDGRLISLAEVNVLARLPGREVLLSQVLAGLQGPMAGFAGALTALLRGFATVVDAYAKKRAAAEPTAPELTAVEPAAAEPAAPELTAAEPVAAEPAAPEPTAVEPPSTEAGA